MSVLNRSGDDQVECPLCMEPLEVDDLHFYPCTCGYQICRFCWNRIREIENGLCPACRKAYPENPADFTPLSQEQVAAIKTEKKAREQKRRNKTLESRRLLANVRVVQNNLVFVVGLPVRLADPEILKRQEYFGKYGKIHKVVINQSTTYAGSQGPSASAYVTYVTSADALRAIQGVNNVTLDGRVLKGSLGTTKYCANFMKNQHCPKQDCMYLHELGDPKASFTKEEMHAGLHQVYERKLHNQLLQATKEKDDKIYSGTGTSTNAEKSSSKDGNQSNFIPTTVVTSTHINNVVNSKSKKESVNGGGISIEAGTSNGKEAWPSLGSSPPSDTPPRKLPSPKPQVTHTDKSQENGTISSESSSPTELQIQPQIVPTRSKETDKPKQTNGQKKKAEKKHKNSNSINEEEVTTNGTQVFNQSSHTQFNESFITNDLDELESDIHSLLDNHDLLDNSDHSLLEDDTHSLLNDVNNEVLMMQRHRDMMAGLADTINMPMKTSLMNGYGMLDREINYLGNDRTQISQGIMDQKELLLRERSRSEMMMRQNEMLARQQMVESKHYNMPSSSIGMESASELLGANYHSNPPMLPFGMRVDSSMGNSMNNGMASNMASNMSNGMASNMGNGMASNMGNGMASNMVNGMGSNMPGPASVSSHNNLPYMLNQHMLHQQNQMPNGYDAQAQSEGRYLAENMDKFFTDFHKAQQMRQMVRGCSESRFDAGHVLAADRLEVAHKQRMGSVQRNDNNGVRAAGDGDDDLDFDPFKETQKALAEMMETENMQNNVSSGDNMDRVRRSRMAPPGFSHLNSSFGALPARPHSHHQGFNTNSAVYSDWTQMDPAIMSTSVNFGKNPPQQQPQPQLQPSLNHHQQELFARFNQLNVQSNQIKINMPLMHQWPNTQQKLPWPNSYNSIPLPPGFAPPKNPHQPAECIDAK